MKCKYNLSEEQIKGIRELYNSGNVSQTQLAKDYNVPRQYVVAIVKGFSSLNEYLKHLAKKKGFSSINEYREHLAKKEGFSSYYEYQQHLAKENGFSSRYEYQQHIAKENGFSSLNEYLRHLAKENGFSSYHEYREHLAKKNGFSSLNEYREHLAKRNGRLEQFKIQSRLRSLVRSALKSYSKSGKIMSSKEYGLDYFSIIEHLKPFPRELNKFHIDHIIPVSMYDLEYPEEIKRAFNPLNLRWLPGKENCAKKNRVREEDLEAILEMPGELYPKSGVIQDMINNGLEIAV